MVHFFHTGRKLFFTSSVNNMNLGPETKRCSCRIHSYVSAADYRYLFAAHDRRLGILAECLHQVASCQIFICREHTVRIFSGDSHKLGKPCAGADEYSRKAFFCHKLIDGYGFSHNYIGFNCNTQRFYVFNFLLHYGFLGKTEFRDSVYKNAAGLMQRFKNGNLIAHLCQISRTGQSCRAGTDNSNLLALFLLCAFRFDVVFPCPVGYVTLQLTDGNRLPFNASDTFSFTLAFLRAYTAAYGRKRGSLTDNLISRLDIPFPYLFDKAGDVDGYRTAFDTLGILAVNASCSFFHSLFFIISKAHLFKIGSPHLCILFSYRHFL